MSRKKLVETGQRADHFRNRFVARTKLLTIQF